MPLVGYNCEDHGYFDTFHNFSDVYECACPKCGKKGSRVWEAGTFTIDFKDGWDPGLGEYISTKRQRESVMREKNLQRVKD